MGIVNWTQPHRTGQHIFRIYTTINLHPRRYQIAISGHNFPVRHEANDLNSPCYLNALKSQMLYNVPEFP
jgi:hypothetical protein